MKDVARYAGVSTSTVSRVINHYPYIRADVRERVLHAATILGYRTNAVAKSMRLGRSNSIGLVVRDMLSANFAEICSSAEAVAEAKEYDLYVCNSNRGPDKERRYIDSLLKRRVSGLIIFPVDQRIDNLDLAREDDTPVVLVGSSFAGVKADCIDSCDASAAFEATQHLIELGHSRIAILVWGHRIPTGEVRLAGFESAMAKAGHKADPAYIRYCGHDRERAMVETNNLLAMVPRPTALIVSAIDMLPGALGAIRRSHAISVPRDLSVIAFDDSPLADCFIPPLSVMKRDVGDIGAKAVELLINRISNPSIPTVKAHVPFSLVQRASTAEPITDSSQ
ncbi:MAG: LacI family DNA-binding transcriptional regulator [Trueperaceae bacterium]